MNIRDLRSSLFFEHMMFNGAKKYDLRNSSTKLWVNGGAK
jgi:hypothetical protein